jgi:N-sulfoglucosamine sulfohydrolase
MKLNRVGVTTITTLLFLAVTALAQAPKQKSVILMIADDHSFQLGAYGDKKIKTPNLDRLAAQGVRFSNAFATVASCSASRAVILTGLYTHSNGQFGHAHDYHNLHTHSWVEPLPKLLKRAGYSTGLVGKFHVKPEALYGFDVQASGNTDEKLGDGARNVYGMAQAARKFIEGTNGKPFYLHVGYSDPHRQGAIGFANRPDYPGVKPIKYTSADVTVPPFLPDNAEVREELAGYYESISRLDQGVGLMLDVLKATGRDQDTVVMYISDNGMPFPGAKTNLYDPGVHLPLIVSAPDQKQRGIVNHAMVSWVDLTPTILDWANAPQPKYELPGKSFLPILEEENPAGRDEVFFSHVFHEITMYYPIRGLRTRQFKYLVNLNPEIEFPFASDLYGSPTWQGILKRKDTKLGGRTVKAYLQRAAEELYDLSKDPHEVKNVANDPQYAATLKELRQRLHDWRKRTNDPWLILNDYKANSELR